MQRNEIPQFLFSVLSQLTFHAEDLGSESSLIEEVSWVVCFQSQGFLTLVTLWPCTGFKEALQEPLNANPSVTIIAAIPVSIRSYRGKNPRKAMTGLGCAFVFTSWQVKPQRRSCPHCLFAIVNLVLESLQTPSINLSVDTLDYLEYWFILI